MAELATGSSCLWLDWPLNNLHFLCLPFFSPRDWDVCCHNCSLLFCIFIMLLDICRSNMVILFPVSLVKKIGLSTGYQQLPFSGWGREGGGTFTPLQCLLICSLCAYFHFIIRVGSFTGNWWIRSITSSVWVAKCNVYLFNNEFSWQCPGHYLAIDWYLCPQMVKP